MHSEPVFLFALFFGVVILGIMVAGLVFNLRARGRGQPEALMQGIRKFQDTQANAGWRIQLIPFDDATRPMMMKTNGLAAMGALVFLAGFLLLARPQAGNFDMGIELVTGGLLLCLFGVWSQARNQRRGWQVTTAQCVDRELKEGVVQVKGRTSKGWFWRMICEYEYGGKKYRVTPQVYWMNFTSEAAANSFYEQHVSPAGQMELRFNPDNPRQTELKNQDIKDVLLYNRSVGWLVGLIAVVALVFGVYRHLPSTETAETTRPVGTTGPATTSGVNSWTTDISGPTAIQVTTNDVLEIQIASGAIALVQFTSFTEDTAAYRWRFRARPAAPFGTGTGTLQEFYDPAPRPGSPNQVKARPGNITRITAGGIQLKWSSGGGTTFGWVYYAMNRARIEVLDAAAFDQNP